MQGPNSFPSSFVQGAASPVRETSRSTQFTGILHPWGHPYTKCRWDTLKSASRKAWLVCLLLLEAAKLRPWACTCTNCCAETLRSKRLFGMRRSTLWQLLEYLALKVTCIYMDLPCISMYRWSTCVIFGVSDWFPVSEIEVVTVWQSRRYDFLFILFCSPPRIYLGLRRETGDARKNKTTWPIGCWNSPR